MPEANLVINSDPLTEKKRPEWEKVEDLCQLVKDFCLSAKL